MPVFGYKENDTPKAGTYKSIEQARSILGKRGVDTSTIVELDEAPGLDKKLDKNMKITPRDRSRKNPDRGELQDFLANKNPSTADIISALKAIARRLG